MFQYYSLFNPKWILEKKGVREGNAAESSISLA